MADRNSTPRGVSRFPLSKPVPAVLRGRLCHVVVGVAFVEFRRAACAWSALEAHRLDRVDGGAA
jgi:hypothetical protein